MFQETQEMEKGFIPTLLGIMDLRICDADQLLLLSKSQGLSFEQQPLQP